MSDNKLKNVSTRVTLDCLKKLKIAAINEDVSLIEYVRDILERHVSKKKNVSSEVNVNKIVNEEK